MRGSEFDEVSFFSAVERSGARALLIGRRAMVVLAVEFDSLWSRRVSVEIGAAKVFIPSVDDLILTKRIGGRPKDAEDIRLLQRLKEVQE